MRFARHQKWLWLCGLTLAVVVLLPQVQMAREAWFSHWSDVGNPLRATQSLTKQTLQALDLQNGQIVADIGAGSGFYSVRLAQRVGPKGQVTATEANHFSLLSLYLNRWRHDAPAIRPTLQTEENLVPEGHFDRILVFNVFPFRRCTPDRTAKQLADLAKALKPGGKLVIVHDVLRQEGAPFQGVGCGDPTLNEVTAALPPELRVLSASTTSDPGRAHFLPGYLLELALAEPIAAK
jgi:SAM-dependent methyltransferase